MRPRPEPLPTPGLIAHPVVARIARESEGRLLTADEEQALGRLVQAGRVPDAGDDARAAGLEARNLMVERNLALVWKYANAYLNRGLSDDDLYGHGVGGLIHAAERFDPERGLKFSTYAVNWVKQRMGRATQELGHTVRLPVHIQEFLNKLARARRELSQALGRWPTDEEAAAHMGVTARKVAAAREASRLSRPASLDALLHPDHADERDMHEAVADPNADDPHRLAERGEVGAIVGHLLGHLDERRALVLRLRHGIGDGQPRTLEQVGRELGLTRERVRQLEAQALDELRERAARMHLAPAAD